MGHSLPPPYGTSCARPQQQDGSAAMTHSCTGGVAGFSASPMQMNGEVAHEGIVIGGVQVDHDRRGGVRGIVSTLMWSSTAWIACMFSCGLSALCCVIFSEHCRDGQSSHLSEEKVSMPVRVRERRNRGRGSRCGGQRGGTRYTGEKR
jgi:hypothetical protein